LFASLAKWHYTTVLLGHGVTWSYGYDIDHIVVCHPVDQLVLRIDAGSCRHLIDQDLEGLLLPGELLLFQMEHRPVIFLPVKRPMSMKSFNGIGVSTPCRQTSACAPGGVQTS
jgi:hypothetical protein